MKPILPLTPKVEHLSCLKTAPYIQALCTILLVVCFSLGSAYSIEAVSPPNDVLWSQSVSPTPDYPAAAQSFAAGKRFFEEGNFQGALSYFQQAVSFNPTDAIAWQALSETYWELGQYGDALNSVRIALSIDDKLSRAWNILGGTHLRLGQCEEGVGEFQTAIELDPTYANAYLNLGACYIELDRYLDAIDIYSQGISIEPDNASLFFNRGKALQFGDDCQSAIQDFKVAVSLNPVYSDAYNEMANCYQSLGQYESAVESIDIAIRINPIAKFYSNRAEYLRNLERYSEAIESVFQALQLDENYAPAYRALGNIYFEQGNYTTAIQQYTIGVEKDPNDFTILYNLGLVHYVLEEYDKAAESWQEIAERGQESDDYFAVLNNLAYMYADKLETNLDRALEYAELAVELAEKQGDDEVRANVLDTLAWVHYKLGNCDQADSVIRQALALMPESETLIDHAMLIETCSF